MEVFKNRSFLNMNRLLFLFCIIFSISCFSQTSVNEAQFNFKFKKAHTNTKFEFHTSHYFIKPNENQKRIQIRFRTKSLSKKREMFDPNKFYMVSNEYKNRYRPVDIKHNFFAHGYLEFERLDIPDLDTTIEKKENYTCNYDYSVKDTFLDYKIAGFNDVNCCVNYGTKKKPNFRCIYYRPKKIRLNYIDVYFIVPKEYMKGTIYYGNEKLVDFELKK